MKRKLRVRYAIAGLALVVATTLPFTLAGRSHQTPQPAANKHESNKPLSEYTAIVVEPFTVEQSAATKDFPAGEQANLQLRTIGGLRLSRIFEKVIDGSQKQAEKPRGSDPSEKEAPREVILSGAIIGFTEGSSGVRFMTWPLPVGVSKAKARFVFRDAETSREVYRLEKEAKYQAALSGGIATKQEQVSHVSSGLVDALLKEIQRNR
jgi:hypothetical protein